ncbi:unnamed protein product, partial [marine sediment metagenome]
MSFGSLPFGADIWLRFGIDWSYKGGWPGFYVSPGLLWFFSKYTTWENAFGWPAVGNFYAFMRTNFDFLGLINYDYVFFFEAAGYELGCGADIFLLPELFPGRAFSSYTFMGIRAEIGVTKKEYLPEASPFLRLGLSFGAFLGYMGGRSTVYARPIVSAKLLDASGNGRIEPGESARLQITIQNEGDLTARQVKIAVNSVGTRPFLPEGTVSIRIGRVPPHGRAERSILLKSVEDTTSEAHNFSIICQDKDGGGNQVVLSFNSISTENLKMSVAQPTK